MGYLDPIADDAGAYDNATWLWTPSTWTQVDGSGPSVRDTAAMVGY